MFEDWKVLHVDEIESENILFCRALTHEKFGGHCESVRSIDEAKIYVERGLYTPQSFSRPDIIVINWHPDCDAHVLEFVHWIRRQPQLLTTPVIVFITAGLPLAVRESAHQAGVTEMIVRPGTFEELLVQVQLLLERCTRRCMVRQTLPAE
jgi:CheY-like chemotaxis protein